MIANGTAVSTTVRDDPGNACHFGRPATPTATSSTAPAGGGPADTQLTAAAFRGHSILCPLATVETAS